MKSDKTGNANLPYGTYGVLDKLSELLENLIRPPEKPRPSKQKKAKKP